ARGTRLLLQIGAFSLYPILPYLKEQNSDLRLADILYNEVGNTVNHFLYEECFDGVIVESEHMHRFMRACTLKPNSNIQVVKSGIDLSKFAPSSHNTERSRLRIGYIGRFSVEKNPLGFITLAERLTERLLDLSARVVGEGPLSEEVKARIA